MPQQEFGALRRSLRFHDEPANRTKRYRPGAGPDHLDRPRLWQRLDQGCELPLTLLVAPAGYGKSALAARWLDTRVGEPYVWLSLDPMDADPRRFLSYLLAGLESQAGSPMEAARKLQPSAELTPPARLASCLAGDLENAFDQPVHVVLDDVHILPEASPVFALIRALLERPCWALHLMLLSRVEPPLPLATLRARNWVAEITTHDLKFTLSETAQFLSATLAIEFQETHAARLHAHLEGWPAGLRLAAHAVRGVPDPERQLAALPGTVPDVSYYVVTEVLDKLPDGLRDCLVRSSMLDRFCASLLDAVVVQADAAADGCDGEAICEALRRGGVFAVVLDPQARWLRFQHTFRDVLQQQLARLCSAAEIAEMHDCAAKWFEQNGFVEEAIAHAKLAGNVAAAAAIVERRWRTLTQREGGWWLIATWLRLLPANAADRSISLQLAHGWIGHYTMDPTAVRDRVAAVEALLQESTLSGADLADLEFFRAMVALSAGDLIGCERHARAAIPSVGERNSISAGTARTFVALAQHMNGAPQQAMTSARLELATAIDEPLYMAGLLLPMAYLHMMDGQLSTARHLADDVIEIAVQNDLTHLEIWGAYVQAFSHLQSANFVQAIAGFARPHTRALNFSRRAAVDALCGRVLSYQLDHQPEMAAEAADELREYAFAFGDNVGLEVAESCRARLALLQGDFDTALGWARSQNSMAVPRPYSLLFWIEVPRITQLRAQIVAGSRRDREIALEAIAELRVRVQKHHLQGQDTELATLTALALTLLGRDEGSTALAEAVALAAPGQWQRPFVEAGNPIVSSIGDIATTSRNRPFLSNVLKAVQDYVIPSSAAKAGTGPSGSPLELLTQRELEILGLVDNLLNKQIAAQLNISDQTVKDHLKHIYRKLDVGNRHEAFAKGIRLGVIKESPLA